MRRSAKPDDGGRIVNPFGADDNLGTVEKTAKLSPIISDLL